MEKDRFGGWIVWLCFGGLSTREGVVEDQEAAERLVSNRLLMALGDQEESSCVHSDMKPGLISRAAQPGAPNQPRAGSTGRANKSHSLARTARANPTGSLWHPDCETQSGDEDATIQSVKQPAESF